MPERGTLSALLADMPERKLIKLRDGIKAELQRETERLNAELRMVEQALSKKRARARQQRGPDGAEPKAASLSRAVLLAHVIAMGRPVKPQEVQASLQERGIDRTVEAVRIALTRLKESGKLVRGDDGRFAPRSGESPPAPRDDRAR